MDKISACVELNLIEHHCGISLQPLFDAGLDHFKILSLDYLGLLSFFSPSRVKNILQFRANLNLQSELELILEQKVGLLCYEDPDYPPQLRAIYNAPRLLYYMGSLPPPDAVLISVVGSRDCTLNGQLLAQELGGYLASSGIAVVSGLARGIDKVAHDGVIQKRRFALGVLGMGLLQAIKPGLTSFQSKLLRNGMILSEFPLRFGALKRNFPLRNRIITGLSIATIVVEAHEHSGSMVSARLALEQGREVFAFPGPLNCKTAFGCHLLIRSGAHLVSCFEDILTDLNLPLPQAIRVDLSPLEVQILEACHLPLNLEDLLYRVQKPVSAVLPALQNLVGLGLIQERGLLYSRAVSKTEK